MRHYQYAFIGAGNMAKGIIGGMIARGISPKTILTSTKTVESGQQLIAQFGIDNTQNNNDCLAADVIVLAVKPQILAAVLSQLDRDKLSQKLIVSVIAGIPCQFYLNHLGAHTRLVRTMPNMPSQIGQGMTGLYAKNCRADDKRQAEALMQGIGKILWLKEESGIDYVNAISGSGPAYVYGFIHHLASAGEKLGLSYPDALLLATQTTLGAAKMVEKENADSPEKMQAMIAKITSKGGTTFEAMKSFEKDDFATIIDHAVQCCYQRAITLGNESLSPEK